MLGDTIDNIDEQIKDFEDIIKELDNGEQGAESIIDNLYGEVAKGKVEVKSVEPKLNLDTLSKYTDYISKGTLERLTILAGTDCVDKNRRPSDYQYASLPDAGISELLRDCELIDANLRDDASVQLLEPFPDYDSLSAEADDIEDVQVYVSNGATEGKTDSSIKSTTTVSVSIDENEKGAPSIEIVRQPTKEQIDSDQVIVKGSNTTKIYLPEIGVEFDYENSIASFESDRDFESPPPPPELISKPQILNLVTITGRKVIVDEFAAKVEQQQSVKQVAKEPQSVVSAATARSPESETKKYFNQDKQPKAANNLTKAKIKVSESKHELVDKAVSEARHSEAALQSGTDGKSYRLLRRNCLSFNMPRPQLLSVIDSKNSAPKKDQRSGKKAADVRVESDKGEVLNQTEREFLHKVDSVRNYWSKMVDDGRDCDGDQGSNLKQMSKNFLSSKSSNDIPEALKSEDFQSFFPTVEIVELNGETKAALVTSRKLNDVEFDHVRYKVMKSDMFQKNLLVSNRKETQFDGLMQYLHDYSFQELLANNNVVIIEPVRTKIEKITEQPNKAQSAACKITNGAGNRNGLNNLKKHFFYHPIRVNKELYEEELPVPDTVRNVRKLFEGSLKRRVLKPEDEATLSDEARKAIRYLAIDTSFDNNNLAVSKWDSISLSSGVSSAADLNSPCDCHESTNKDIKFICSSKENLDSAAADEDDDDGGEFKSHFVSDDVMEKIRECGSSITYYGGQTLDKKTNSDLMTKAIMKEISSQKCGCQSKRPRAHHEKAIRKLSNDYSGEWARKSMMNK